MVDVAMLDSQIALLENAIARYGATGEVPGPIGARHPSIAPFEAYATKDSYVVVAAGNDTLFAKLCAVIERPELVENPLFATNDLRVEHVAAVKDEIEATLTTRDRDHWLALLEENGIPCGPINNVAEAIGQPQIEARTMVITTDDPVAGPIRMAGNPVKISGFDDPPTRKPSPELDADRASVLDLVGSASDAS